MPVPSLLTVGTVPAVGFAGGIPDTRPHSTISANNESATAIEFGQVVVAGVAVAAGATQNVKPQTADGDKIVGVAMASAVDLLAAADGTVNYARYKTLPVKKTGPIFCIPMENVTAQDAALVVTAGSGSKIGGVTGGAVGAGRIAFPGGAVWETTTASGALGVLLLNIP